MTTTTTGVSRAAAVLCFAFGAARAPLANPAHAAARSVHVIIKNNTDRTMVLLSSRVSHGEISRRPPAQVPSGGTGELFAESNGLATGTEGSVKYRLEGTPGEAQFNWDNPFVGGNSASSSAPQGYATEQVGDRGNRTLVFFSLQDARNPVARCAAGWVLANLGQRPEDGLDDFSEAIGFLTTPGKRMGIGGWVATGCSAQTDGWIVRDAQHSTDGFWTLDVKLHAITVDGQRLPPGVQRYVRIEVEPGTPAHGAVAARPPRANQFVRFGGTVLIDTHHGDELVEVHPWNPIVLASGPLDSGPDTCKQGFVWRDALPGDHVCVVPGTRDQARLDNGQAAQRRAPGGGAFGPGTCRPGFVWRAAMPDDHVCVAPAIRQQVAEDNGHGSERREAH